ncbi:MAG: hypothetical protein ACSHXH_00705 [Marivita sp.]|uniref:hypothetical protein n=1 Tax=Marivita sp. TaxID=2003365 RepID=UPI003EF84D64
MFEAQRQWTYRLGPFEDRFRYQYVISRTAEALDGFTGHVVGNVHVHCGSHLPVSNVYDSADRPIGLLLGIAAGTMAVTSTNRITLPFSSRSKNFWARFESFLNDAAGRYAFVLHALKATRLYTDPVGMIGAVYNAEDGFVASSPLLAIKRPLRPNPKVDLESIRDRGGKLSLFNTADAAVRRMNPNCYLDLDALREHRFWPRDEQFTPEPETILDIYAQIIATTRANIAEITGSYPCSLPVTGGMDSRLILAFAGEHAAKLDQVYTHINNYATRRDAAIAADLCRVAGVAHDVHDKRQVSMTPKDIRRTLAAYQVTYGAPVKPPKEYLNGVITGVPDGNVVLRGHQTDLLRAVFVFRSEKHWRTPDWQIERLLIVPRADFDSSIADRHRDDFLAWQATLPDTAMAKAADFMFLEVYYPSTVGASFPALWRNFYLSPYNSRTLIALSLQFSERRRRAALPVFELIEVMNSDLSKIPFDFEAPAALDDAEGWQTGTALAEDRIERTHASLVQYTP